ncbi:MAG: hypothetical protein DCC65_04925 [Planctomycetota bacterium]|nr:MAG: hypothetical protein DCC65_04925 [Planctomycetota bacterium]
MNHMSRRIRRVHGSPSVIGMAVFLLAATGAAGAEGAARSGTSFLQILLDGAEWPGVIIVAMSLAAVTIIIEHFWTIRRSTMVPEAEIEQTRQLIEGRRYKECIESIKDSKTMFADVLTAGLRHGRHGFDAMHEAASERANAWASRLFRKAEYLNIIGNLGPLMGLLGTVLGMIEAFGQMQASPGGYKPENLAGGISLALVNTFLGLAVAIVSMGFFGICRNRVDAMTVAAHAAAMDLLEYFRPITVGGGAAASGSRRVGGAPARPAEPAPSSSQS